LEWILVPKARFLRTKTRALIANPQMWRLARSSIVDHGGLQNVDELTRFAALIKKRQPRTILEIGTALGRVRAIGLFSIDLAARSAAPSC
jgi:hypothetical protein